MGKVLEFKRKPNTLRIESQPADLTKAEVEACEIARSIKAMFTAEQLAEIEADLSEDE